MDKLNRFTYTNIPAAADRRRAGMEVIPMGLYVFIVSLLVFGLAGSAYSAYKISSDVERTELEDWGNEYD